MKKTETLVHDEIDQAILKKIAERDENPSRFIQKKFSISRQAVTKRLRNLIDQEVIESSGVGRGTRYKIKSHSEQYELIFRKTFPLTMIAKEGEDLIYRNTILPALPHLGNNSQNIVAHIFTEMLNNAMDHSAGSKVDVVVKKSSESLAASISDDGAGVFNVLKSFFGLESNYESITELLKGKRTTDRANHAGEGLYFSMRLADNFVIEANNILLQYVSSQDDYTYHSIDENNNSGTKIYFEIELNSNRKVTEVFNRYTNEDFQFVRDRPFHVEPYTIAPTGLLVSRSEAKRFIQGARDSESIIVDFKNAKSIGQGFADELFRVWATKHPSVTIYFKADEDVERMIIRANPPLNVKKFEEE